MLTLKDIIKETSLRLDIPEEEVKKEIDTYMDKFFENLKECNYYEYDFFYLGKLQIIMDKYRGLKKFIEEDPPENIKVSDKALDYYRKLTRVLKKRKEDFNKKHQSKLGNNN